MPPSIAEIALPIPVRRTFHYRIPPNLAEALRPGKRVLVPFRNTRRTGWCVGLTDSSPFPNLRPIFCVLDPEPLLAEPVLQLARWIAHTYLCSLGEALQAAVPSGARRKEPRRKQIFVRLAADEKEWVVQLGEEKDSSRIWYRVLRYLRDAGEPVLLTEACRHTGVGTSPFRTLERKGLLNSEKRAVSSDRFEELQVERTAPRVPTLHQRAALDEILARVHERAPAVYLLHGVTGSGKTEVYLQSIAAVVEKGQQAIVLVPEIALTPQTVRRFRERFDRVAVLHSQLTEAQRAGRWRRIRSGEVDVVVGARSAVFAPVPELGLIVVDEEHEPGYKQESVPRYHARETAVQRARIESAIALLGSATPSLEAYHRSRLGEYRRLVLPQRVEGRPLPPVQIVDMAAESAGRRARPAISRALELHAREALANGEQVIFFLNRRGYTTFLVCPRCKYVARCGRCDVALTFHRDRDRAVCHHCFDELPVPGLCPSCGQGALRGLGIGTQRVEKEVQRLLEGARILRMDRDSMRRRGSYELAFSALDSGEVDVLVGTQLVAKGFDFPRVTVVGVISGDTCLHLQDFRSTERTFQLVAQVAGRAGRGPAGGHVIVQTFNPGHECIAAAAEHDYERFASKELKDRRELGYPPFTRLLRILFHGRRVEDVERQATAAGETLRKEAREEPGLELLGPVPAPLRRLRGHVRIHILVKAPSEAALGALVERSERALKSSRKVSVELDVDPVWLH